MSFLGLSLPFHTLFSSLGHQLPPTKTIMLGRSRHRTVTTPTQNEFPARPPPTIHMFTIHASVLGIIEFLIRQRVATRPPIILCDLLLNGIGQIPEIAIVFPVDVMRQLMAQRLANRPVIPVPIVRIRAQAQLDDLASVAVETQRPALVRGMLGRVHLRQDADGEFVFAHAGFDARVVAQALEEAEGFLWVREVGQGAEGAEGVGCVILGFLPVAVRRRFDGGGSSLGSRGGGGDGGGGGGGKGGEFGG